MTEIHRLPLSTGVTLNVALAGDPQNPAVILLHGFPESHRTWREVAPRLEDDFFLVMPDQRGFAGSDLPQDVDDYKTDMLIDDILALADALGIEGFALVGRSRFEFRVEAFNVLNKTNFGAPNSNVSATNFGTITGLATTPRQVQLGVKFDF